MTKEQLDLLAMYIQIIDLIEDDMWGGGLSSIALNQAQKDYLREPLQKLKEVLEAAEPLPWEDA